MRVLLSSALLWTLTTAAISAQEWPQFRGPTGLGYTQAKNLPLHWGGADNEHVLWKAPLVGEGHASPIVWHDRVFVCTVHWAPDVNKKEVIPDHHVLCFNLADGKLLWDTQVPPGPWKRTDFRSGPGGGYAGPTPATDGKHVFCVFGSSVMAALDFSGKIAWRKEIVPHTFDVTIGTSPILYGDTVIFLCAMANQRDSHIAAYKKSDGSQAWRTELPKTRFGHGTPIVIKAGGRDQLVFAAGGMSSVPEGLQSVDPANGKRLWWCNAPGESSSPAFGGGLVYCDSGRGGPGFAVDPTGTGDVTETHIRWKIDSIPEAIGSPVIVGDYLYRLHRPNVLKCFKASDGEQVYAERLDNIGSTWASPIVDPRGNLYFATAGKSFVIKSGPMFEVLAENDLGDPNHASPAVAGNRLLLLGTKHLFCVGE